MWFEPYAVTYVVKLPSLSSSSVGPLDVNTPLEKASGYECSKLQPNLNLANVENIPPYAITLRAVVELLPSIPIRTLRRGSGTAVPFLGWLVDRLRKYLQEDRIAEHLLQQTSLYVS